jgi:hypothetical protein
MGPPPRWPERTPCCSCIAETQRGRNDYLIIRSDPLFTNGVDRLGATDVLGFGQQLPAVVVVEEQSKVRKSESEKIVLTPFLLPKVGRRNTVTSFRFRHSCNARPIDSTTLSRTHQISFAANRIACQNCREGHTHLHRPNQAFSYSR